MPRPQSAVSSQDYSIIIRAHEDAPRDRLQLERCARVVDVVLELCAQRFDTVELALTAKEVGELHAGTLPVEVTVEVEEVSLEQRVISVFVERRSAAEVYRARMHFVVRSLVPTRVDAIRRHAHLVGHLDVRCGKPEQTPPLVTSHHDATHFIRTAEHLRRDLDITAGERTSDRGRADRLLDAISPRHQLSRHHLEV